MADTRLDSNAHAAFHAATEPRGDRGRGDITWKPDEGEQGISNRPDDEGEVAAGEDEDDEQEDEEEDDEDDEDDFDGDDSDEDDDEESDEDDKDLT